MHVRSLLPSSVMPLCLFSESILRLRMVDGFVVKGVDADVIAVLHLAAAATAVVDTVLLLLAAFDAAAPRR